MLKSVTEGRGSSVITANSGLVGYIQTLPRQSTDMLIYLRINREMLKRPSVGVSPVGQETTSAVSYIHTRAQSLKSGCPSYSGNQNPTLTIFVSDEV